MNTADDRGPGAGDGDIPQRDRDIKQIAQPIKNGGSYGKMTDGPGDGGGDAWGRHKRDWREGRSQPWEQVERNIPAAGAKGLRSHQPRGWQQRGKAAGATGTRETEHWASQSPGGQTGKGPAALEKALGLALR